VAATTLDRNTKIRLVERTIVLPLATGAKIPYGTMVSVATPSVGAVPAADTATHVVQGWASQSVDQTAGDTKITVLRGVANFANDGTITAADVGQPCTVLDNQTVSKAATTVNDIGAGYIEEVDSDGVWVSFLGGKIAAT